MKRTLFILLSLSLMVACTSKTTEGETETASMAVDTHNDTLVIDPSSAVAAKIQTSVVTTESHDFTLTVSGVVTARPSCYAEVSAPFSGRIQRSLVRLGQQVSAGQPLFELYSADYSEVVKNLIQAKSSMETAQKALNRVNDLHSNHVASDKELEEAQALFAIQQEEYRHAMAVAREYHVDTKKAEVGQPMVVRSPIAGRVLSNDLVIGQYVKDDAPAMLVIADLSSVWVKANITECEAPLMEQVNSVKVQLVARPQEWMDGKVVYGGGLLDPESRTLQTVIECKNTQGHALPNMYANIELTVSKHQCIIVPKEAVLQGETGRYVLRKTASNTYVRTIVEVQSADDDNLIVTQGLTPGQEIATQGAFYLIDCR